MSAFLLKGISASEGIAIGKAYLYEEKSIEIFLQTDVDVRVEKNRFAQTVEHSLKELQRLKEDTSRRLGDEEAAIFESHMLLLQDPELITRVNEYIELHRVNAEYALEQISNEMIELLQSIEDEYIRGRSVDLADVTKRLLFDLMGIPKPTPFSFYEPVILVAHDLSPSHTALIDISKVRGFVTDIGTRTSHTAILARSMELPAVVGLTRITEAVQAGTLMILDGTEGKVIIEPTTEQLREYEKKRAQMQKDRERVEELKDRPTITLDGHQVKLGANIGTPQDLEQAIRNGAEGIGLFRTEYLYLERDQLPSEEEQFLAYQQVAIGMNGKSVIIRTLDIGGDKALPYLSMPKELNPFLGQRAIRFCLEHPAIFKSQLRAILRASLFGKIKMMYPMISTIKELRAANQLLAMVKEELSQEQIPYQSELEVGIMIEVPAAVLLAEKLAQEVDFFSIGTNDLIQYTLAIDRLNERVAHLYQPLHPTILNMISTVIEAAHKHNKWVGMCGEMAGDPDAIPLLLGLGLDELSMNATSILPVRKLLAELDYQDCRGLAQQAIQLTEQEEVLSLIKNWQASNHP